MSVKLGKNQKKMLIYLFAGIDFCLSPALSQKVRIVEKLKNDLEDLKKRDSERALTSLEKRKFVRFVKSDDKVKPVLTKAGIREARILSLDDVKIIKPTEWDKKWTVVSFDVPEKIRFKRNALRGHLKRLDFFEIHQSLFLYPYPCQDEIRYIAHHLDIDDCVHIIIASKLDHEQEIKKHFEL